MSEEYYQIKFIEYLKVLKPLSVLIPKLKLTYSIGKYSRKKVFGMPDFELDILEIDEQGNFHLWELKLLNNSEIWNGKIFGQLLIYDFIINTEPWTELYGRVITKWNTQNNGIIGTIERINKVFLDLETDKNTEYGNNEKDEVINSKPAIKFKSWNLVICGGDGYEIAEGYNPMIWSLNILKNEYFKDETPNIEIWHFYEDKSLNLEFRNMYQQSIYKTNGLTEFAWQKFKEKFPDWEEFDDI